MLTSPNSPESHAGVTPLRGKTRAVDKAAPVSPAASPPPNAAGDPGAPVAGVIFKTGDPVETVLVVDDYADARACIRDMLEDLGHEVTEAADGREALHFLLFHRDVRVKLIVLDLQMPTMTGWELLSLLESYLRLANIPVVIASAHGHLISRDEHSAIVGCLQSPYKQTELRTLVEAAAIRSSS